jgi:hypothetical protein
MVLTVNFSAGGVDQSVFCQEQQKLHGEDQSLSDKDPLEIFELVLSVQ